VWDFNLYILGLHMMRRAVVLTPRVNILLFLDIWVIILTQFVSD